jgi:hypothetical protein
MMIADMEIDTPTGDSALGEACNPLVATSCRGPNSRCVWFNDQDNPPMGHNGCAPPGTIAIGNACTTPAQGAYSACVAGSDCIQAECKSVCDSAGGTPACDASHACVLYADFLDHGAGVCDVGCDPLTQDLLIGTVKTACGSPTPSAPTKGCFGFGQSGNFTCAPSSSNNWSRTDRTAPQTNASGNPYLNGCAPGFMPLLFEMTGSTTRVCSGLCYALETDNTAAHMNNARGSSTALGKLPMQSVPQAGYAACTASAKGSETSSACRFYWPTLVDETTQELPPGFEGSQWLDRLGYCIAISHYQYDANNDSIPDTAYPSCASLPPRSAATPGKYDDAADWGCQLFSNSQASAPAMQAFRAPIGAPVLERHPID